MSDKILEWVHATHIPQTDDGTDAVVVKAYLHKDTGEVVPILKVEQDLARPFWITKPQARNHEFKKEWEQIKYLDRYDVPNYRLEEELNVALNGPMFGKNKRKRLSELCESPYVYGADIHIETLLKQKYQTEFTKANGKITKTTTGFLDIETDVVNGNGDTPNIITVTHENKVYTAILEQFFVVKQSDGTFKRGNLEEFTKLSKKTLDEHIDKLLDDHLKKNKKSILKKKVQETPFEYFYFIGKTPVDCIRWIFLRIHENKTDFIGIWNLDFDIPKILNELKNSNVKYEDVFCPPGLPQKYRYVKYVRDEKDSADIYKKWHWLHATAYCQFLDSMCLYRILRTVKGLEGSMSLDNILKVNDLGGKLTFKDDDPVTEELSGIDYHRYMQKNEAYKYIIYNQFDCISIQLMEWKNDDIGSMNILGGVSRLCKWPRQTRKVCDGLYFNALEEDMVTASPGPESVMFTKYDKLFGKTGGAVLRPERTSGIGLKIFEDRPDIETYLHNFVSDVDFSGMYPNSTVVANVSKETKVSTGYLIEGFKTNIATQQFYSMMVSLHENAAFIGNQFFGLPGYEQMEDSFKKHLETTQ